MAERLAEGLVVPKLQMGEEVPRAEESTAVLWAGAADKDMGEVQGPEPELRPCFPFLEPDIMQSL